MAKQIERRFVTTYRWWRDDGGEIPSSHVEILDESAGVCINNRRGKGFLSGELYDTIDDEIEYTGHWEIVPQDPCGEEEGMVKIERVRHYEQTMQ